MEHKEPKWKVCVRCYTYNHAPYITDTLNGFIMQQTNFPFVCCIVDDASTDGEQEILKKYIKENFVFDSSIAKIEEKKYGTVIFCRHKTNENCFFATILLNKNHYSKPELKYKKREYLSKWLNDCVYEGICEGDDYWIDPLKLREQVEFLDNNPEYGMCYTNFNIYYQNSGKIVRDVFNSYPDRFISSYRTPEEFILNKSYICPPSWLYRKELLPSTQIRSMDGTFSLFTHFLVSTKVKYLDYITATYRILSESATHSKDIDKLLYRFKNVFETQVKLIKKYNLDSKIISICEETYYKNVLVYLVIKNDKEKINEAREKIKKKGIKTRFLLFLGAYDMSKIARLLLKFKN